MVRIFKYAEEQGKVEEARQILKKQIKAKFGNLDEKTIKLINKAKLNEIEVLTEKIITTDDEQEFKDYLK
jgi:hypothetical protein